MSHRVFSSCTRLLSPVVRRRAPSAPPALGHAARMSSGAGQAPSAPSKPPKAAAKTSTKNKNDRADAESSVVEKGDTYKAGETYFSFHPYSYYDLENLMESRRLKQPCSGDKAL